MTRDEIQTAVLHRLTAGANSTADVTQVVGYINLEYQRVAVEEALAVDSTDLVLAAGSSLVDLPDDFGRVISLRRGATVMRQVTDRELSEYEADLEAAGSTSDDPALFTLAGSTRLRVAPAPTAGDVAGLQLVYAQRPPRLTGGTQEPDVLPAQFHDFLVERVVARIAQAEEAFDIAQSAAQEAQTIRAQLRAHIGQMAGPPPPRIPITGRF